MRGSFSLLLTSSDLCLVYQSQIIRKLLSVFVLSLHLAVAECDGESGRIDKILNRTEVPRLMENSVYNLVDLLYQVSKARRRSTRRELLLIDV